MTTNGSWARNIVGHLGNGERLLPGQAERPTGNRIARVLEAAAAGFAWLRVRQVRSAVLNRRRGNSCGPPRFAAAVLAAA
jgi:hypothetical protein